MPRRTNALTIGCYVGGSDYKMFIDVWNQGIDSYLEGFGKSKHEYYDNGRRLMLTIDPTEIHIMVRRLRALGTEHADQWAADIEESDE